MTEIKTNQAEAIEVFNFIESSRFEIDRRTGAMTSRRGFQAMCEAADVSGRKF